MYSAMFAVVMTSKPTMKTLSSTYCSIVSNNQMQFYLLNSCRRALANTTNSNLNLQIPSINIKLERDNYSLWRSTIISALETFELESFILNPAPPMQTHIINTSDALNPTLILFYGRNVIILSYCGLNPPYQKKALSLVVRATSSHMAWTAIEKTFQAQTRARRMAMKVQLQTLTKRSLSMLEYIERKRFIADSLAKNLHPISDEDLIGYILSSLDSSYSAFSTAFIMKSDDVSVDDLVGLLLQEEARLEQEHVHQAVVVSQPTNPTPLLSTSVVYTTNQFSNRQQKKKKTKVVDAHISLLDPRQLMVPLTSLAMATTPRQCRSAKRRFLMPPVSRGFFNLAEERGLEGVLKFWSSLILVQFNFNGFSGFWVKQSKLLLLGHCDEEVGLGFGGGGGKGKLQVEEGSQGRWGQRSKLKKKEINEKN
ncbi:hypothetical protein HKD37_13G036379 [Glycine soja]